MGGSSVNEKTFTSSNKLILDKSASLDHHSSSITARSRAGRVASVSAVSLNEETLTQLDLALENEGSIGDQEAQPLRSSPPPFSRPASQRRYGIMEKQLMDLCNLNRGKC